ncbi:unnamed protein product [Didymodactylos carnosus]|uniref:Uncharacterized protein n=1 Tax=Didymodactylos carnosus TaxID=1234261 RepID=A0A813SY45_9BILA|nr:unnamed protein product [Didymodactylos carnosus]CAF0806285.1 unnamed protein product [Didymodactylos carnosus]CAF3572277.1 unnamed protein product [Didymodactylos carnosus]CAF3591712.1 unnamed protein product [Didymodactylos carnosus]
MAERRFTIQSDPRGILTGDTTNPLITRDDTQTKKTGTAGGLQMPGTGTTQGTVAGSAVGTISDSQQQPQLRRQSVFRRLSMSMGSRKSSMNLLPTTIRPNTFRMEPENEYRFRPYRVQPKVMEILIEQLKDKFYNPQTVTELVKDVSRNVHMLMKNFPIPRYKIIVQTVIGQKYGQLIRVASRCLWDVKTDNMISVNYETKDMIAIVTVYAIYFE